MEKKAEYKISSSFKDTILEIIITGELAKSAHEKMTHDVCSITKENSVKKVLIDMSALIGRLGITEIYESVRNYPPHMYKIQFAMVDIPENADIQSFHETTAINAGMKLKCCYHIDDARVWLKNK